MKIKILVLVLLMIGLAGIAVVYFIVKKFYSRELALRLSPLYENNVLPVSSTRFWLVGDSRIFQWPVPEGVISKKEYCNLGVNSQTTAQVFHRLRQHFESGSPKYVFIQVGINDLKAIGVFPGRKEQIIRDCTDNILAIIRTCTDHEATPVFVTIFPPGPVALIRRPVWSDDIKNSVVTVNAQVVDFCTKNNVAVFDAYAILDDGNGLVKKDYQLDDLHLNGNGYSALNRTFEKFLTTEKIK